jgi:hypothetical protein
MMILPVVSATWWNSSFDYRKELKFEEKTGNNWVNYSINYNITYAVGMQADFDDLRFVDAGQGVELPYYIEHRTNSASAKVWIKTNLTTNQNISIYMYYGNAVITNKSNRTQAFLFDDDGSVNRTGEYTYTGGKPQEWVWKLGNYRFRAKDATIGEMVYPTILGSTYGNVSVEARLVEQAANYGTGIALRGQVATPNNDYKIQKLVLNLQFRKAAVQLSNVGTQTADNTWYNATIWAFGSTINATGYGTASSNSSQIIDTTYSNGYAGIFNYYDSYVNWTYLRIRAYATTEPIVTAKAEESRLAATINFLEPPTPVSGNSINSDSVIMRANVSAGENLNFTNYTVFNYSNGKQVGVVLYSYGAGIQANVSEANFTLPDGRYYFNTTVMGNSGLKTATETRLLVINKQIPFIIFSVPKTNTPGSTRTVNDIYVQVNVSDVHAVNYTQIVLYDKNMVAKNTSYINHQGVSLTNSTSLNFTSLMEGLYYINASTMDAYGRTNSTLINISINNPYAISYNNRATLYETESETYWTNWSYDPTMHPTAQMYLWLNGVKTAITPTDIGGYTIFTYTRDTPTGASIKNISAKWQFAVNTTYDINSTNFTQLINPLRLLPYDAVSPYCLLNITVSDETTLLPINAAMDLAEITYYLGGGSTSVTYSYTNASQTSPYYSFCFNSTYDVRAYNFTQQIGVRYSATGYAQRFYTLPRLQNLTNPILDILLLNNADGSPVSFSVQTQGGNPIAGATVTVERLVGATWTTVGSDYSGDDGVVTFVLNTLYNHKFTFEKDNYNAKQVTIRPSQSFYTVYLDAGSTVITNQTVIGLRYSITPVETTLNIGSTYNFTLTVHPNSTTGLTGVRLSLLFPNGTTINATALGSFNSTVSVGIPYLMTDTYIIARYYVTTTTVTDWYNIDPTRYSSFNFSVGKGSLWRFLTNMNDYRNEDTNGQFSTVFWTFLVLLVFLGVFNNMLNFELSNPTSALILVGIVTWVLSIAGFLTVGLPGGVPMAEKYIVALTTTFLAGGIYISRFRDNA